MTTLLDRTVAAALAKLRPPPRLPLSEWMESRDGIRLPEGLVAKPRETGRLLALAGGKRQRSVHEIRASA